MIKVEHANKTFSGKYGKVHALQDVSIHVEKGDIYGIIGFSGAGKSTLIRLVNQLERPDTGSVNVDGRELTALSAKELRAARRDIGMVFQQFNLLERKSVYHNVAMPLILDDVTVQCDAARTVALLDLLHEVSKERQVVLFSQETGVRAWAREKLADPQDRLIELFNRAMDALV